MIKKYIPIFSLFTSIFLLNYNIGKLVDINQHFKFVFICFLVEFFCIYKISNTMVKIHLEKIRNTHSISNKPKLISNCLWMLICLSGLIYSLNKNPVYIFSFHVYKLCTVALTLLSISFIINYLDLNVYYMLAILLLINFFPYDLIDKVVSINICSCKLYSIVTNSALLVFVLATLLRILRLLLIR